MRSPLERPDGRRGHPVGAAGTPETNGGTAPPPAPLTGPLFAALDERGVPAAIVRTEDEEMLVLVHPAHRERLAGAAAAAGLTRVSGDPVRGDVYRAPAPAVGTEWHVVCVTALRYGAPLRCLGLGEPMSGLLARRMSIQGVPYLAPEDRMVDHTLHALLDDRGVPPGRQRHLRHLLDGLRSEPVRAGRAAEAVQRELAPAVPWGLLLAHIVLGRWHDLASRRRHLARHLFRRRPVATLAAALRDVRYGLGRPRRPREAFTEAQGDRPAGDAGVEPKTELLAG